MRRVQWLYLERLGRPIFPQMLHVPDGFTRASLRRIIWKSNRKASFQDDGLAARLRSTREQRHEIGRRMVEYKRAQGPPDIITMPGTELAEKVTSDQQTRLSAAVQSLWDVLDPSQIERFERLIERVSKLGPHDHAGR
jgi:hypothetical protein